MAVALRSHPSESDNNNTDENLLVINYFIELVVDRIEDGHFLWHRCKTNLLLENRLSLSLTAVKFRLGSTLLFATLFTSYSIMATFQGNFLNRKKVFFKNISNCGNSAVTADSCQVRDLVRNASTAC